MGSYQSIMTITVAACLLLRAGQSSGQQSSFWRASAQGRGLVSYIDQNTVRGAQHVSVSSWAMVGLARATQSGYLGIQAMLSMDPLTQGDCGVPRMLTRIQGCPDHPFEDRSLTHPLILGLSASAESVGRPFTARMTVGLAGEPAVGPPNFMHRASAAHDPLAPLTQHATNPFHVVNGFITAGLQRRALAVEFSAFNGAAGNADPYDFDFGPLKSWATRVRWEPGPWQIQVSTASQQAAATLQQAAAGPHSAHGGVTVTLGSRMRVTTASAAVQHSLLGLNGDALAAWSQHAIAGSVTNAFLLEESAQWKRHGVFARIEAMDRIEVEHRFNVTDGSHEAIPHRVRVVEAAAGYNIAMIQAMGARLKLGTRASLATIPQRLSLYYDLPRVRSFSAFVSIEQVRAAEHKH